MRVAVSAWFWDSLTTGSGHYTRRLVAALARTSPDIEIVLVGPRGSARGARTRQFVAGEPLDTQLGGAAQGNLTKAWFEQVSFPATCRQFGVDIAHVPYWAPPVGPAVPTIVTIHDLIPRLLPEYRGGLRVRAYTELVSRSAHRAALVLTDSQASRADIVEHLRLPSSRVRSVHLAADDAYDPKPADEDAAIRARHGVPERYVLYLGGFDVRKNVTSVVAAFRAAEPELGPDVALVFAGQLPEEDSAFTPCPRRIAREQGLGTGRVKYLGRVAEAEKASLYRGALALLFPSRYEGFGLPPLEAMACGTPVVGSNRASMPEVVGAGGVLFDPDDAAGMGRALVKLAADGAFRQHLGRLAVEQAARFSWKRTAEATLAAYQDALSAAQ